MKTHLYLFPVVFLSLTIVLSACGGPTATQSSIPTTTSLSSTAQQPSQSSQPSAATTGTSTIGTNTAKTTTTTTAAATSTTSGFAYKKLDVLSSYHIVLTAEALAGSAIGFINKYDANHNPLKKEYQSAWYSSRDGGEFTLGEECIVIGSDQWVKPLGKGWTTGSSIADNHMTFLSSLYLALSKAEPEKIEETTVSGIPVIHYSYLYETKSSRMKGEVWIASQSGMQPVPLKALGEQMALDEKGTVIEDYRHIRFAFEVNNVNEVISIKAPI